MQLSGTNPGSPLRRILMTCVFTFLAACASAPAGSNEPLERGELLSIETSNVYEALHELRPRWLQRTVDAEAMGIARRAGSPPPLPSETRCLNMAYIGDEGATATDLRRLPTLRVMEVRLIPARGTRPDGSRCSHDRPAIHVVLLSGG